MLVISLQNIFFRWSLETKKFKSNNFHNTLSKSSPVMYIIVREIPNCYDLFFSKSSWSYSDSSKPISMFLFRMQCKKCKSILYKKLFVIKLLKNKKKRLLLFFYLLKIWLGGSWKLICIEQPSIYNFLPGVFQKCLT